MSDDMSSALTLTLSAQHTPERDVVVLPFEVSREVVVLPDVRNATPGLLHQLQSVVIQVTCHLEGQKRCNVCVLCSLLTVHPAAEPQQKVVKGAVTQLKPITSC